ncbi:MAG: hypothetical protein HY343_12650 [Lentisphaerae bacterium]|nr:hypothetical protein [Lentisphaerota bacterium]
MKTIEMHATVTPERQLTLSVPEDIMPGIHEVVLIIDPPMAAPAPKEKWGFPVIHMGSWPERVSLRREDLYGDSGR